MSTILRGDDNFDSASPIPAGNFTAKAWVNFNGTGTVSIRADGNVSSITDEGTGQYKVNFSSSLGDVNYSATGITNEAVTGNRSSGWCIRSTTNSLMLTSSIVLDVGSQSSGGASDHQVITMNVAR